MSGIHKDILWNVVRLNPTFTAEQQSPHSPTGTGFWLKLDQHSIFVTNKHMTDPRLKLGNTTPYRLNQLKIEFRKKEDNVSFPNTQYFEVKNLNVSLHEHPTADCAILVNPKFKNSIPYFKPWGIDIKSLNLASAQDFTEIKDLSPQGSFVGFPSNWYDTEWNLPITRPLTLASYPDIPFSNAKINTSDVHLVSGLSFQGSSGSPVFLHQFGVNIQSQSEGLIVKGSTPYIVQKIIGIMSGHWEDISDTPEMFKHSRGLSYYTRSTAILDLLKKANLG